MLRAGILREQPRSALITASCSSPACRCYLYRCIINFLAAKQRTLDTNLKQSVPGVSPHFLLAPPVLVQRSQEGSLPNATAGSRCHALSIGSQIEWLVMHNIKRLVKLASLQTQAPFWATVVTCSSLHCICNRYCCFEYLKYFVVFFLLVHGVL